MKRMDNKVSVEDKPTPLGDRVGIAARDYTDGKGVEIMGRLLQNGAIVASSVSEALEIVKRHLDAYAVESSKSIANEQ
jgi:hypothetical protein